MSVLNYIVSQIYIHKGNHLVNFFLINYMVHYMNDYMYPMFKDLYVMSG